MVSRDRPYAVVVLVALDRTLRVLVACDSYIGFFGNSLLKICASGSRQLVCFKEVGSK